MMFQRRHYEAVAGVLHTLSDHARAEAANRLAEFFGADNPNFSRSRFFQACDVREVCAGMVVAGARRGR